jgi:O-antigen/teichoic acid export membrane protein
VLIFEGLNVQINPSRFNSDFLLSILSNFILIIVSIFQGIIIARALGPSGKGVTAVYMTMFSLVYAFSNLGIRQSSAFYISRKSFNYDKIFTIQLIFILFSSIITLLAMILISISQGIYNYSYLKYFYFIVPLNLFNTYITSFALAERNITILNLSKVVTSISLFSILFFFYFINSSKNIEYYFLAQSASLFVTAILLFTWTRIKKINLHF